MEALKRHMTASTVTGYLAIFGLSVAFAAGITAESSGPRVLQAFVMGTPNMLTQVNNPMSGAMFDAVGFYNHPCYVITGEEEAEMCQVQYGLTTSLQTMLLDGSVAHFIQENGLQNTDRPAEVAVETAESAPAPVAAAVAQDTLTLELEEEEETLAAFQKMIEERGHTIWRLCSDQFEGRRDAAMCYQRNVRFVMRLDVDLEQAVR